MEKEVLSMNTVLRDISLVWLLIHSCIMFILLYESRYPKKKSLFLSIFLMGSLIIINLLSLFFLGAERGGQFLIFTCVLPSLLFFFFMAKNRDFRFLFTFCLIDTIILEVMVGTKLLDLLLGIDGYIILFLGRLILPPFFEFLIIKYIRKPYFALQKLMKKGWGLFSLMATIFYALFLVYIVFQDLLTLSPKNIPAQIILGILLILVPTMYFTIYIVLANQIKIYEAEEEKNLLNMQIQIAENRMASYASSNENLRITRHDMKHYLRLLYDYIESGDLENAKDCINTLSIDIDQNVLKSYCKNNTINIVLSYYDKLAQDENILFKPTIRLPEFLPAYEKDIAIILSNALENAVNALKHSENKTLSIKAFLEDGITYLEIKNPCSQTVCFENGIPQSTRENHGYGTKSIVRLVENHGGMYSFVLENGYFVFRCSM